MAHDVEVMASPTATPRQKVASRLCKIEKGILGHALGQLETLGEGRVPSEEELAPLQHLKLT